MKTERLTILTTDEFKKEVEKAAKSDNKTLSGYVTDCLLLDLKKRRKKNERTNIS